MCPCGSHLPGPGSQAAPSAAEHQLGRVSYLGGGGDEGGPDHAFLASPTEWGRQREHPGGCPERSGGGCAWPMRPERSGGGSVLAVEAGVQRKGPFQGLWTSSPCAGSQAAPLRPSIGSAASALHLGGGGAKEGRLVTRVLASPTEPESTVCWRRRASSGLRRKGFDRVEQATVWVPRYVRDRPVVATPPLVCVRSIRGFRRSAGARASAEQAGAQRRGRSLPNGPERSGGGGV